MQVHKSWLTLNCLIFLLLCHFTPPATVAQQSAESRVGLEIKTALAQQDSATLRSLVKNNRYQVVPVLGQLLDSYLENEITGANQEAQSNLKQARHLANVYHQSHKSQVLLKRVALFKGWTFAQTKLGARADSLFQVALDSARQTRYPAALRNLRKALGLSQKIGDEFTIGSILEKMGMVHRRLARYDAASDTLTLALDIVNRTENRDAEGNVLRELGVVTYLTGNPDGALAKWQQARDIFKAMGEKDRLATTLNHIGVYYKNRGQPRMALTYYQRALKIHREIMSEPEAANDLNNIGNVHMDYSADYTQAIASFEKALAIKRKYYQTVWVGAILGNLGICYKKQGDYQNALKRFNEAVRIGENLRQPDLIAKSLLDIGILYTDIGNYQRALPYLERALRISRDIGQEKFEVETLINEGATYGSMEQFDKALALYGEALDKARQLVLRGSEAVILQNMAEIESARGHRAAASRLYDDALKIVQEIHNRQAESVVKTNRGDFFLQGKDLDRALSSYQGGLNIALDIDSPENIWRGYYGIANVLREQNELQKSLQHYAAAIETIESLRNRFTAGPMRESFMAGKIEVYHAIIRLLLELNRVEEAFDYLERAKAQNLLEILSSERAGLAEADSANLLRRSRDVEWHLRSVNQTLRKESAKSTENRDARYILTLRDSLEKVRFQHEEILRAIRLDYPQQAQLSGLIKPMTVHEMQTELLSAGRALLEYLVADNEVVVWVVTRDRIHHARLPIPQQTLVEMVTGLRRPFDEVKTGQIRNILDVGYPTNLAYELYQKLFQPIEQHLSGNESVIIVPDGVLHYLPFEALIFQLSEQAVSRDALFSEHLDIHYLVERYAISYSTSASVLDPDILPRPTSKSRGLLALGNPRFDDSVSEQEKQGWLWGVLSLLIRGAELNDWRFAPLPGTAREVQEIAAIMNPSKYFLQEAASEFAFKKSARHYRYIHLATHAIAEELQPEYSRLVLAGSGSEDGLLHAYELMNLRLNADLVTLSACETGLGKLSRGEGLIGLTRALMYAGTPSVIVSLWSVDDLATVTLMRHFYKALRDGESKADALRKAKLKLLHNPKIYYRNPFLWAPFVLVGAGE